MDEQTDGRPENRGGRFTDRGQRFGRRRFLGTSALAVGTGLFLAGCKFDDGPYQGAGTGQSSTSGQNATPAPGQTSNGQGSSGSQSGTSS